MKHETFDAPAAKNLVYIKAERAKDLAAEMGAQTEIVDAEGKPFAFDPDAIWYVVHAEDGSRIAILDDRDTAFAAARANSLEPVSVH
jgi:hypothetical protein